MKSIDSIQKHVNKYYPGAMLNMSPRGQYYVGWHDQNLNDIYAKDPNTSITLMIRRK